MQKQCPSCKDNFIVKDLVTTKPKLRENRKWFEPKNDCETCCPNCNDPLSLQIKSLWPFLLFIPASIFYFFIPAPYDIMVLVTVIICMFSLAKFTIKYDLKKT